jgi:putative Ca2+/H+ antiporter (TMEM165/GDT1 family)
MAGLMKGSLALLVICLVALSRTAQSFSPSAGKHFISSPVVSQKQFASSPSSCLSPRLSKVSLSSINNKRDQLENSNDTSPSSSSSISNWANDNKINIAASAALIAAAAFVNPSVALASTTDALSTTSVGTFMEKLSETGFYQAFSLVFVSEIGDKTFFIAGLLAMKVGRVVSLIGSIGALAVMTIISVIIGQLFHAVPPGLSQGLPLDDIAAVLAFTFFGFKTLKEASEIDDDPDGQSGMDEEFADAEEAVEGSRTIKEITAWGKIVSTFGLVFAAEFGDRSFLSTIALSAAQNPVSVAVGAIAAHAIATAIAVAGGSYVAKYISEKYIGYIGGTLFIVFAVTTALGIF